MRKVLLVCGWLALMISDAMAHPADSAGVVRRLFAEEGNEKLRLSLIWQNPSVRIYQRDYSRSGAALRARWDDRGAAAFLQTGNRERAWGVSSSTYAKLSETSRFWGTAAYENSSRKGVRWNDNDDLAIIYPYLTGDSYGGFLRGEEYAFSGGYAHRMGRWALGGEFSYRAKISYRDKDPRPKNVCSDLRASIGASTGWGGRQILSLSAFVRRYHQRSDIRFLSEGESERLYQLQGLGTEYVRFSGAERSAAYEGAGGGAGVNIQNINQEGWMYSLSGSVELLHITRQLTNRNYLPLNELYHTLFQGEFLLERKGKSALRYGALMAIDFHRRTGWENLFGATVGSVYPKIGSSREFQSEEFRTALSPLLRFEGQKWLWRLHPQISFYALQMRHRRTERKVESRHLGTAFGAECLMRRARWMTGMEAKVAYSHFAGGRVKLPGTDSSDPPVIGLRHNLRLLSSSDMSVEMRWKFTGCTSLRRGWSLSVGARCEKVMGWNWQKGADVSLAVDLL